MVVHSHSNHLYPHFLFSDIHMWEIDRGSERKSFAVNCTTCKKNQIGVEQKNDTETNEYTLYNWLRGSSEKAENKQKLMVSRRKKLVFIWNLIMSCCYGCRHQHRHRIDKLKAWSSTCHLFCIETPYTHNIALNSHDFQWLIDTSHSLLLLTT